MELVIYEGNAIRLRTRTPILDFDGNPVNPDVVQFRYSVNGSAWSRWYVYGTDANVGTTGTGMFYMDVADSTGHAGEWLFALNGYPDSGPDTTETRVYKEGRQLVTPQSTPS